MKKAKSKNESQQPEDKYIPSIPLKKIPSEKALQILRKAGHDVNEEQSEEIMEFLYTIVKLTLKEFFTSD
ncbi:hypothetical protein ACFOWU_06755 [Epilithonimonas zeae]|uniref:DUF2624 family protein n=1 Tax=Epilithonimonas zeae TaxID=1416779 RepID=A0A1N6FQS7_9FLAO|nr:hypothetical protein [Epilithonimonas zeae]SIN97614.1 hypothetical protein SAMN05444409_1422 [Epilithonimonas zeae]